MLAGLASRASRN